MSGWLQGWMDGRTDGKKEGRTGEWENGCITGWMGWMDGLIHLKDTVSLCNTSNWWFLS